MTQKMQGMRRLEWPTWCLLAVIYGGFAMVSYFHRQLPIFLLPLLGGWFVCWHSQMQHECIHGHPTRWQWMNDLIAFPPLALWLPYPIYAASHRSHHATDDLTIQGVDPESFYWTAERWRRAGPVPRFLATLNQTLFGRMLLGPFLSISSLIQLELRRLLAGDISHLGYWLWHVPVSAGVLYWVVVICDMSVLKYLLCFALPGTSLALVRSFCEHVPTRDRRNRTRTVEGTGPLAWLFLFNNLHVLHHLRPGLPWYALPSIYQAERSRLLKECGSPPLKNYTEVFRRYFRRIKESPVSPIA